MRKEIGEAVRKQFHTKMMKSLHQFREIKSAKLPGIAPGSRVYAFQAAPHLWFFLNLVPSVNDLDRFTLEGAWGRDGRLPSQLGFLNDPRDGSLRFRLPKLWDVPHGDYWWELTEPKLPHLMTPNEFDDWLRNPEQVLRERIEEGMRKVPACVDEAFDRVLQYALPYFNSIARGSEYPRAFQRR